MTNDNTNEQVLILTPGATNALRFETFLNQANAAMSVMFLFKFNMFFYSVLSY